MDILYILIPVSLLLVTVIVALVIWAVNSDQFADLESPAHRILLDDDGVSAPNGPSSDDSKPPPDRG